MFWKTQETRLKFNGAQKLLLLCYVLDVNSFSIEFFVGKTVGEYVLGLKYVEALARCDIQKEHVYAYPRYKLT